MIEHEIIKDSVDAVTSHRGEVVKKEKKLSDVKTFKEACFVAETLITFILSIISGDIDLMKNELDEKKAFSYGSDEDEKTDIELFETQISTYQVALDAVKKLYDDIVFAPSAIESAIVQDCAYVTFGAGFKVFADSYEPTMEYAEERNFLSHYHKLMKIYVDARKLFHKMNPISIDAPISYTGVNESDAMIRRAEEHDARQR